MSPTQTATVQKRIWDLPVRLTHWGLVISFFGAHLTSESNVLPLHEFLAFVCLALVIFRLFWGVIGSQTARFSSFVKGKDAVLGYFREMLKLRHKEYWGHNPAGAIVVLAIFAMLIFIVGAGLFAQHDSFSAPWASAASPGVIWFLTQAHAVVANWLLALVILHIAAIAFYRLILRDDLIKPMITGTRPAPESFAEPAFSPLWLAVILFAISVVISGAAFRYWIF